MDCSGASIVDVDKVNIVLAIVRFMDCSGASIVDFDQVNIALAIVRLSPFMLHSFFQKTGFHTIKGWIVTRRHSATKKKKSIKEQHTWRLIRRSPEMKDASKVQLK